MGLGTAWDTEAPAHLARLAGTPAQAETTWYGLADGALGIRSDDRNFAERFDELYEECRRPPPHPHDAAQVRCTVRTDAASAVSLISFDDPEPLDQLAFALALFPDRGYREIATPRAGWRLLDGAGTLAFTDGHLVARHDGPWQRFAANLAVNRVLRLQRGLLFFHAAAVAVRGGGVLLMGPKGAGKTTLALGLAARGHGFLGDEIVGLRLPARILVPLRRASFIKPGPAAAAVAAAMRGADLPRERFPDGGTRWRANVGRLLGAAVATPVPLGAIVFLRGFGPLPRLTPLAAGRDLLASLTPLASSLWGDTGRRSMQLMQAVSGARCLALTAGAPDATADLVERTLEDH